MQMYAKLSRLVIIRKKGTKFDEFYDNLEDGCNGYQPTIDMNNFQIPEDFNLERVVEEVTKVGVLFIGNLEMKLPFFIPGFWLDRTQVNVLCQRCEISQRHSVSVQQGGQHYHGQERGREAQE